ncbi:lactonase family protein [Saccharopolyspora sp. HNM0983]|uniref:Lactonase family protein n=1 Tax=Saccharopolyspora montiporae TaxID=2781240 RepID=A0A929FZX3_9PSEU|nr:lactonase family protein [Saccharopolyspora sp. HNM0983]MBE9373013.1 lactonase family protein [Saccharopolyspora sp. HNM0983]
MPDVSPNWLVHVGAGREHAEQRISTAVLDSSGALLPTGRDVGAPQPSFLAASPDGAVLFAVDERTAGRVRSYRIGDQGALTEIGAQPSLGSHPCHLAVHPGGAHLFTANYASATLAVHPVGADGALGEAQFAVQHTGRGPNPERQEGPHPHQVVPDPGGQYVLAADLGADAVVSYEFDPGSGHLAQRCRAALRPGSGPRHLALHPDGDRGYVLNELDSSLTEFGWDRASGQLEPGRTLSTVPPDFARPNLPSEVVLLADGSFGYAANRGHDSIAVFTPESGDGQFRLVEVQPARVSGPRHIALSPDGTRLLALGRRSDDIQVFDVLDDGHLSPVGDPLSVPAPMCAVLLPAG